MNKSEMLNAKVVIDIIVGRGGDDILDGRDGVDHLKGNYGDDNLMVDR